MQGKGWEMYESKRSQEENIDIFKTVKKLFDLENPRHSPIFTEFKTTAKRKFVIFIIKLFYHDKFNSTF